MWTENNLALKGSRIVIPAPMRQDVLKRLYAAHQGIERTLRRARQLVYWPGISNDITNMVRSCDQCQTMLPSLTREPMMSDPPPSRVFEDVSVDIFSYSVLIRCDNGPQFSSHDFIQFTNKWGVKLAHSTPHYPQSNGHAEAAVKAMKTLLRKTSPNGWLDNPAFLQGLLEWRNTPKKDGMSPVEIV